MGSSNESAQKVSSFSRLIVTSKRNIARVSFNVSSCFECNSLFSSSLNPSTQLRPWISSRSRTLKFKVDVLYENWLWYICLLLTWDSEYWRHLLKYSNRYSLSPNSPLTAPPARSSRKRWSAETSTCLYKMLIYIIWTDFLYINSTATFCTGIISTFCGSYDFMTATVSGLLFIIISSHHYPERDLRFARDNFYFNDK